MQYAGAEHDLLHAGIAHDASVVTGIAVTPHLLTGIALDGIDVFLVHALHDADVIRIAGVILVEEHHIAAYRLVVIRILIHADCIQRDQHPIAALLVGES